MPGVNHWVNITTVDIDIGVDGILTAFRGLKKHIYANRVREDMLSCIENGVNGTPTFFINGIRYDGSYDLESLLTAIAAAMVS